MKPPEDVQLAIDEVLQQFSSSQVNEEDIAKIEEWVRFEDWDELISDMDDGVAFRLGDISELYFEDNKARDYFDLDVTAEVSDQMKVAWVKHLLTYDDNSVSLHGYGLKSSNGGTASICCIIRLQGQGGPDVEWKGVYKNRVAFLQEIAAVGDYYLIGKERAVPEEVILSRWQR